MEKQPSSMKNECEMNCDEQYCDVCEKGKAEPVVMSPYRVAILGEFDKQPPKTMEELECMIAHEQYDECSKRQDEIIDLLKRNTECLEQCAERLFRAIDKKYPIGGMRYD